MRIEARCEPREAFLRTTFAAILSLVCLAGVSVFRFSFLLTLFFIAGEAWSGSMNLCLISCRS